jgi:hypothetical protein
MISLASSTGTRWTVFSMEYFWKSLSWIVMSSRYLGSTATVFRGGDLERLFVSVCVLWVRKTAYIVTAYAILYVPTFWPLFPASELQIPRIQGDGSTHQRSSRNAVSVIPQLQTALSKRLLWVSRVAIFAGGYPWAPLAGPEEVDRVPLRSPERSQTLSHPLYWVTMMII